MVVAGGIYGVDCVIEYAGARAARHYTVVAVSGDAAVHQAKALVRAARCRWRDLTGLRFLQAVDNATKTARPGSTAS